jgi:hypothetical protein
VIADEDYLRSAIVSPKADLVEGYGPLMPEMELSDREIETIVEYIRTL